MNGIIIIDKPAGMTSHDVVARLRKILKIKQIGHTGTLDPFATGVLVMLIGKATRLARFLDADVKEYEAIVQFGVETDTGDSTGLPISDFGFGISKMSEILEETEWEDILDGFRGEIEQVPPMYSAKKVNGKKLYELARQGIEIERNSVPVKIHKLELLHKSQIPEPKSQIGLHVVCSAGTYIRTLAEEIGHKIGTGAHLLALRRLSAGKFDLSGSVSIEKLESVADAGGQKDLLISMNSAISHLRGKTIGAEELKRIRNGVKIDAGFAGKTGEYVRLIDEDENLVALGTFQQDEKIQPRIVFY